MKRFRWLRRPKRIRLVLATGLIAVAAYLFWIALPDPLFTHPVATIIEDSEGRLLGARIAPDGQWRFPHNDNIPSKFTRALISFEDKRFHDHLGVDPVAIGRAIWQNIHAGKVKSGASTLSMQVIRLAREGKDRTLWEKAVEALLALRLELSYSKDEILAFYASNTPFGGNVVGLNAAAWRYFGRAPDQLSWAESATLAVLPNNPALVHPGRNRERLLAKRNRLLSKLHKQGAFDGVTLELAIAEPLPSKPIPLPRLAPHLLERVHGEMVANGQGIRARTTIDATLQGKATTILERYHRLLRENQVHNGAILVLDTQTGAVRAYVGNTGDPAKNKDHGKAVDIIAARRSTGSLLKPFLHAAMIQDGRLSPQMLLSDIPTRFGTYAPKNFDKTYSGAVPADKALARSLNVTSVRMLSSYTPARFQNLLTQLGMSTLDRKAKDYGLSLILGGAEGTLWEMTGMYASLGRLLSKAERGFTPPHFLLANQPDKDHPSRLGRAAVWHTLEAMSLLERPNSQGYWQIFGSARKIAWKTGTSFGFRDAWAIGVTPQYTVGVWIGNASGEGRPGLVGSLTAAPVMFEVFSALDLKHDWFPKPHGDMAIMEICAKSGHRAQPWCPNALSRRIAKTASTSTPCPYHQQFHLDGTGTWRVHGDCASPSEMKTATWFVLPPGMAWFYRQKHGDYHPLPPFQPGCAPETSEDAMSLIYPREPTRIRLPVQLDGVLGETVFEAAHRDPEKTVHWHLDGNYLGSTRVFHQMALKPEPGLHRLVLIDEDGEMLEQQFQTLGSSAGNSGG